MTPIIVIIKEKASMLSSKLSLMTKTPKHPMNDKIPPKKIIEMRRMLRIAVNASKGFET